MSRFLKYAACRYYSSASSNTIYALSSGHGKCAIAIIRVTGPLARNALYSMARMKVLPEARKTILRKLSDPHTHEILDHGIVIWFPAPNSFSGEDMCELHVHGGAAVVASVQNSLGRLPGFRPAEPGEFTKRAFLNGKLDLTQVEGLSDLLQAETEMQRRQALLQLDGSLGALYNNWKDRLKKCVANVEAFIDFGEDENIENDVLDNVAVELSRLKSEIQSHLSDSRKGERLRTGVHVTITGKPNVGKSSLFNIICQREAAIVSSVPGTTRDVIQSSVNIGGYPVHIFDTAGIRDTSDVVEQEGVKRAKDRAVCSDLIISMVEASDIRFDNEEMALRAIQVLMTNIGMQKNESEFVEISKDQAHQQEVIVVINKLDDMNTDEAKRMIKSTQSFEKQGVPVSVISCRRKEGLEAFLRLLEEKVAHLCGNSVLDNPMLMQERHRSHLTHCLDYLDSYFDARETDIVLAAYKLHKALLQLGRISGKVETEEILDVIFRDFCIGK